jgi:hypothetical protein
MPPYTTALGSGRPAATPGGRPAASAALEDPALVTQVSATSAAPAPKQAPAALDLLPMDRIDDRVLISRRHCSFSETPNWCDARSHRDPAPNTHPTTSRATGRSSTAVASAGVTCCTTATTSVTGEQKGLVTDVVVPIAQAAVAGGVGAAVANQLGKPKGEPPKDK